MQDALLLHGALGIYGDVLAPLLFNHHTDGLRSPNDSRLHKYADDIAVFAPSPNDSTRLPAALQHVSKWASSNGLLNNHS